MITAIVQFKLPASVTTDQAKEIFSGTASKYQEVKGLIRKYYLLSDDGGTAGGVYLWKSREDADKLYTNEWKTFIRQRYNAEPVVMYFNSPVVVDNLSGEIMKE